MRTYSICVIAMVVAILVGAQLLIRVFDRPDLILVCVVFVGAHFLPFVRAFQVSLFASLAVGLIVVALIGTVITLTISPLGAPATGVAAGFLMLIFALPGGSGTRAPATAR